MTTTIALTSCTRYQAGLAQPVWRDILAADPDYLFLLGDQIYMDFGLWPFSAMPNGAPKRLSVAQFAQHMRQRYEQQWAQADFARLLTHMRAKSGLFGVWDDHDFAWNNAYGADPDMPASAQLAAKIAISRALFHEFMDCAPNPPDIFGAHDTPLARFIFLDNRSFATPAHGAQAALMGQLQMDFLQQQLDHAKPYTLICAGLTLSHGQEYWSRYLKEFEAFSAMVRQRAGVIYLAGDIHRNRFVPPNAHGKVPCYEIVSSGACVNQLGLPFEFDRRRNWTWMRLDDEGVLVRQIDKHGSTSWRIDRATWTHTALGRSRSQS